MKKDTVTILGLKVTVKKGILQDGKIEILTDDGVISVGIEESDYAKFVKWVQRMKENPIFEGAPVKTTAYFDNQIIRLKDKFPKLSAEWRERWEQELKEDKEYAAESATALLKLFDDNGFSLETMPSSKSRSVYVGIEKWAKKENSDVESFYLDEVSNLFVDNNAREAYDKLCNSLAIDVTCIRDDEERLGGNLEDIEFEETYSDCNADFQVKFDKGIGGVPFKALYTYLCGACESVYFEEYDFSTKNFMFPLSLEFCDEVEDEDGDASYTVNNEYLQYLKDILYEMYKAVPGEEHK